MDKIEIIGNGPLKGEIIISGAKNSALKLMAASILTDEVLHLTNMPYLKDVTSMVALLSDMGVKVSLDGAAGPKGNTGRAMAFDASTLSKTEASYEMVKTMRASAIVLGPLLAKYGHARVSLPGGCAIDERPLNIHLSELEKIGVHIEIEEGYITATAPNGLKGTEVDMIVPRLNVSSVGATETLLMAATLAEGTTTLINAAIEPEIVDLCECLTKMGADIKGIGTRTIEVTGVDKLNGCSHNIIEDRIEAGTYAVAPIIAGGEVELIGASSKHLKSFLDILKQTGAEITDTDRGFIVKRDPDTELKAIDFTTEVHPGIPTDLQAQLMALMTISKGTAQVNETIFNNRFMHVPELNRMGANIEILDAHTVTVNGVESLKGCPVMATDLRASASLVLAGLVAKGHTTVNRVYHLDRGYERIEEKLSGVGAKIRRVK